MKTVTVDESVRSQLDNLDVPLELCDQTGITLGYFLPASQQKQPLYDWARTEFRDEDIENARREVGGSTTEEVLARLRAK